MGSKPLEHVELPWPIGFGTPPRTGLILSAIFFIAGSIAFVVKLRDGLVADDSLSVALGTAGLAACLAFATLSVSMSAIRRENIPKSARILETDYSSALRLSTDRGIMALIGVWFAAGASFLLAYVVILTTGRSDEPFLTGRNVAVALLLGATAAAALCALVAVIRSLKTNTFLDIDIDGITLDNGALHQRINWNDIAEVDAEANPKFPVVIIRPACDDALRTLRTSSLMSLPGNKRLLHEMVLGPRAYKIDPALLYYTIRYYLQHPEARQELTSDAVIDRMRRGELLD